MKYVIMADGEGKRWGNYKGIPKHLIEVDGEPIIARTVRLLKENGIKPEDIIITSRDERYIFANRIPQTERDCEIDRFEESVVDGPVCYMYGDVYYTNNAIKTIVKTATPNILFFGGWYEIYAIKIMKPAFFFEHKHKVKDLYMSGKIDRCIGWEVYRSMNNIPFKEHKITDNYVKILDETADFDYPEEYEKWLLNRRGK